MNRLGPSIVETFATLMIVVFVLAFGFIQMVPGTMDRTSFLRGRDFLQFYAAGRLVAESKGNHLYDSEAFQQVQWKVLPEPDGKNFHYTSLYPPMVAVLFAPLGALDYNSAVFIWWGVQALCFVVAMMVLVGSLAMPTKWRTAFFLGGLAFLPTIMAIILGHLSPVLLVVFAAGLAFEARGYHFGMGFCWGWLALKPQFLLIPGLWVVSRRDRSAILGMLLSGLLQLGIPMILVDRACVSAYVESLPHNATAAKEGSYTPFYDHSVWGGIRGFSSTGAWVVQGCFAVAALMGLFRIRERSRQLAFMPLTMSLCTPHLLIYDLVLLIPTFPALGTGTIWVVTAVTLAPVYNLVNFSPVPIVLLVVLFKFGKPGEETKAPGTISETVRNFVG